VTHIYNYFKKHGFETIVMGASFRNIGEIQELAGCDRLTISPKLLAELAATQAPLTQKLQPATEKADAPAAMTEHAFRWEMNEDAMATEKLSQGIRQFAIDQETLESILSELV